MKRLMIILIVLAAATGGGYLFWHQREAEAVVSPLSTEFTTDTVVRGDMTQSVSCTGVVASNQDVLIKCQAGGQVTKLPCREAQFVHQGDLLIQVDPAPEERALQLAQITYDQDQCRLVQSQESEQQAELNLKTSREQAAANIISSEVKAKNLRLAANRQKELLTQKLASNEDFETADTAASQAENDLATAKIAQEQLDAQAVAVDAAREAIKLAEAVLKSDQASVDLAKLNLSYATVNAPMDGIVTQILVQNGSMVSSALNNAGGGTTILTLSDMSKIFVMASVDESDIGEVAVGQPVTITADSFPNKEFQGIVVIVPHEGVTASNVTTFAVQIEVTSANKTLLKPQMTANVTIIEAHKTGTLIVPQLAVYEKKHKNYVKVPDGNGSSEERPVQLGIIEGFNQEITSGLKEGEQILVPRSDTSGKWAAQGLIKPPAPKAAKK